MTEESYWWSGPIGGLGNRLIAIAAVKACIGNRRVFFPWLNDSSCPGDFHEILDPIPNLRVGSISPKNGIPLNTHNWEPLSIYSQLNKELDLSLSKSEFCLGFVHALRHLPINSDLKDQATQWRQSRGCEPMIGVHIRRTDRMAQHRDEFRKAIFRNQGISRELPIGLGAAYGIFPPGVISFYENTIIGAQLKKFKSQNKNFGFSIFVDNPQYIEGVKKMARWSGISNTTHLEPGPISLERTADADQGNRQTSLTNAVVDLLCLASCDAIIQSNRASTFSLVASIIGRTPIVSAKTGYPFWHAIETASAKALYGEGLSSQVIAGKM